jgi:ABC-2 type transport system ATP-binding protein
MTGGPAFALHGLTKRFGRVTAVGGVSVEVARGEVVALLGPNGAGKSTTVDMLLGLTKPDAGEVTVAGGSPREAVDRGLLGAMMQNGALLPDATVGEIVDLVVSTHKKPLPAAEVIARAGLENLVKRRCGKLSGGERQRVRFALALAGDPQLLVLDEPTAAMDVDGRRAFWTAIREFTATGRTVLFATHYLAEAEDYADRVVLMRHGAVVADGPVAEVRAAVSGRVLKAAVPGATEADLAQLPGVTTVQLRAGRAELACADSDAAVRALLVKYPQAADIEIAALGLEEAFLALTADETEGAAA